MTTPLYVDVSAYQGKIDWPVYAQWARSFDGVARVAMKVTEGVGFIDPNYHTNRAGALAAGIDEIIFYHYGRPDQHSDPGLEVAWFRSILGAIRPGDSLLLDYEADTPAATADWAYGWLSFAEAAYTREPSVYASEGYIAAHLQDARLARFPLTEALWKYSPSERPAAPAPWSKITYLQYTDRATVPGIAGPVDADIFLGAEGGHPMLQASALPDVFIEQPDGSWLLKDTSIIIGHGMLAEYRCAGTAPYFGYDLFGRPRTNERKIPGATHADAVLQVFERAVLGYHADNAPRGAGDVAPMRLDQSGPALSALLAIVQAGGSK